MVSLTTSSLLFTTLFILSAVQPAFAYTWGFPYGSQKIRGVNLGGWLVLEVRRNARWNCNNFYTPS